MDSVSILNQNYPFLFGNYFLSRAKVIYLLNHLSRFISLIFLRVLRIQEAAARIFNASAFSFAVMHETEPLDS
jgi:hypothetical protein